MERLDRRVQHLQIRDRSLLGHGVREPWKLLERRLVDILRLRYPAVSLSQEAHEEGPAMVDPLQADLHHVLVPRRVRLRHPPPQVDIHQPQPPSLAPVIQPREHLLHQVIPLRVHIAERAADKDVYVLPGCGHVGHLPSPRSTAEPSCRRVRLSAETIAAIRRPMTLNVRTCGVHIVALRRWRIPRTRS